MTGTDPAPATAACPNCRASGVESGLSQTEKNQFYCSTCNWYWARTQLEYFIKTGEKRA